MPNYQITLYRRNGQIKTGVRWHTSYDKDWVRNIVEDKIKKTIGLEAIKFVDIEIAPHLSRPRIETKHL